MNALTQIGKQISDLFGSMTPSARIMAGLMLGMVVVSLGWIANSEFSSDYESLLGGVTLTNAELDRIESAFGDAQLRDYKREGRQMRIPKNQKDQYLKALSSSDALPKEWGSEIDRALREGSVFESSEKFSARMRTSRERDLANILKRLPGVEFAAVSYDEQKTGFGRETDRVCSIQLHGPFNNPIPDVVMKRVAEMASTQFAGLPETHISVFDLGTANFYRKSDDPHSTKENPVLAARQEWEEYLDDKLSSVLSDYGAVQLMVNVEIDPTLSEELEKLSYDPTTAVTVQSTESKKDFENARALPSGPPGADINGSFSNKAASIPSNSPNQSSKSNESEANERRIAGHDAIRRRTAGLVPTKVSVSIWIPESHYRDVLAHRYLLQNPDKTNADEMPQPTAIELEELKAKVETSIRLAVEGIAVGIRDGDDRKPYVNVFAYDDLPAPPFPEPTLAEHAMGWLSTSWSTLALIALVLVSLGMMFSWVRSQGQSQPDREFAEGFGLKVPENLSDELDLSSEEVEESKRRVKPELEVSGGEIKEDLSTLIRENPDAVVNLLKTWIGEAA